MSAVAFGECRAVQLEGDRADLGRLAADAVAPAGAVDGQAGVVREAPRRGQRARTAVRLVAGGILRLEVDRGTDQGGNGFVPEIVYAGVVAGGDADDMVAGPGQLRGRSRSTPSAAPGVRWLSSQRAPPPTARGWFMAG
jgi:hypothetical protein